jgi:hypothetical protein
MKRRWSDTFSLNELIDGNSRLKHQIRVMMGLEDEDYQHK